jgi:hypothetical protein
MFADNEEELHAMAARIGLKEEWFQTGHTNPKFHHYDIIPSKRELAIRFGAKKESIEDFMKRVKL